MITNIVSWLAKVLLWVRLGWPGAVAIWQVFYDGTITRDEVLDAISSGWPKDENGDPVTIKIPLMRKLRTK